MRQKNKPPRWICVRYNHNLLFDRLHPSNKVKKTVTHMINLKEMKYET